MGTMRYVGWAKDPDTSLTAPAAVQHVDIASGTLDAPSETDIYPPTGIGRGMRMRRPGFYAPAGNFVYAFDVFTIASWLRWTMGGYTFTAGALGDPDQIHEIYASDANLLEKSCVRVGKDLFEHVFRGCIVNSLELAVEDGFALATVELLAEKDAKATIKTASQLILQDEYPLSFPDLTVQRNGTPFSATVKSATLTITNNGDAESGRHVGSRFPQRIRVNARDVRLAMSLSFDSTAELETFWGTATGPDAQGGDDIGFTLLYSAGADGSLEIALPRMHYLTVPTQPSEREEMTQEVEAMALVTNITLADTLTIVESELLATVTNAQTSLAL